MNKEKGFFTSVVLLISLACISGYAYYIINMEDDDSELEEAVEHVIEVEVEDLFHLDKGKMDGKIDLTPKSKENK
jgi:hypothetical protein